MRDIKFLWFFAEFFVVFCRELLAFSLPSKVSYQSLCLSPSHTAERDSNNMSRIKISPCRFSVLVWEIEALSCSVFFCHMFGFSPPSTVTHSGSPVLLLMTQPHEDNKDTLYFSAAEHIRQYLATITSPSAICDLL